MNEEKSVLGLLIQQIETEKEVLADVLFRGTAQDFPQYKELCGKIYGLTLAQRIVTDMEERLRRQAE
jgi:hypothetical protein